MPMTEIHNIDPTYTDFIRCILRDYCGNAHQEEEGRRKVHEGYGIYKGYGIHK